MGNEKKFKPKLSLWESRGGESLQHSLSTAEAVEEARNELIALAESLKIGMYLSVSPNRFRERDTQPTHNLTAYTPKFDRQANTGNDSL